LGLCREDLPVQTYRRILPPPLFAIPSPLLRHMIYLHQRRTVQSRKAYAPAQHAYGVDSLFPEYPRVPAGFEETIRRLYVISHWRKRKSKTIAGSADRRLTVFPRLASRRSFDRRGGSLRSSSSNTADAAPLW